MKKLLLLLLLIPNLVLAENVLYCKDEIATGFIKENGSWRTANFELLRHTIKFNDDYSALDMGGNPQFSKMTCKRPYGDVKPGHIFCSFGDGYKLFSYNQDTKRYVRTSQSPFGYASDSRDTDSMSAGSCEKF